MDYDAFGEPRWDIDLWSGLQEMYQDPVGFGGQWGYYTDQSTGLVLMGHRYYNPSNGRFLTRDPIGYAGGVNLYGFVGNNPVTDIDPEGFDPTQYHLYYGPSGGYGWLRVWHNGKLARTIKAANVTLDPNGDRKKIGEAPAPPGIYNLDSGPRDNWKLSDGRKGIHINAKKNGRVGLFIHSMRHPDQRFFWAPTEGCIRIQQQDLNWLLPRIKQDGGTIHIQNNRWSGAKPWKARYPQRKGVDEK